METFTTTSCIPPCSPNSTSRGWKDRSEKKTLSPELTCLILRICACSAQYLPPDLRTSIQLEFNTNGETLSQRFHEAAQKLSATITPGTGGLTQIQQVFVSAFWFKSESRWIESWHALGAAIREAQEIGRLTRKPGQSGLIDPQDCIRSPGPPA